MRVHSLLAVSFTVSLHVLAPAQSGVLFEEGFEQSEPGSGPAGWGAPSVGPPAVVVAEGAHSGERCAQLDLAAGGEEFGNLIRGVEIGLDMRSRVVLSAAVRVDGAAGGRAQLWLRLDYEDGSSVLADNMHERPITAGEWAVHRIVADVEARPGKAVCGLMAFDGARAHLDDVRLEVVGPAPLAVEPPRAVSERGRANLVAFTRLLGFVRYFHPSDEAAEADWERFAVEGVRRVEGAADEEELKRALTELFAPVAPTVVIHPSGAEPALHPALLAPPDERGVRARAWRHQGMGSGEGTRSIYSSRRLNERVRDGALPEELAPPAAPFRAELGLGLACAVPLTLYSTGAGTLPAAAPAAPEATDGELALTGALQSDLVPEDRATRLAAVVLGWNVFQHFYPYFDVVEVDWPAELERALTTAAEDADARAFGHTLQRMVAALRDGHGGVYHPSLASDGALPLGWELVEGELVVTWVDGTIARLIVAGDVVLAIDDVPVAARLATIEARTSAATPQFSRFRALEQLAQGPTGTSTQLELQIDQEVVDGVEGWREQFKTQDNRLGGVLPSFEPPSRQAPLDFVPAGSHRGEPRPGPVEELEPGLWYVDLDAATTAQFLEHLDAIAAARGVVFDMRGYPDGFDAFQFFPHLIQEAVESAQWHVPVFRRPDREGVEYVRSNWTIQPAEPFIAAERVFITDGRAISYAESCMGIVEHYRLGEIVGEATAGTNGNVNPIRLPGGYAVSWTGMRVLKQDGSQHHGVGIQPTIPVARTRAGIAEERDELLEAALAVLND